MQRLRQLAIALVVLTLSISYLALLGRTSFDPPLRTKREFCMDAARFVKLPGARHRTWTWQDAQGIETEYASRSGMIKACLRDPSIGRYCVNGATLVGRRPPDADGCE